MCDVMPGMRSHYIVNENLMTMLRKTLRQALFELHRAVLTMKRSLRQGFEVYLRNIVKKNPETSLMQGDIRPV